MKKPANVREYEYQKAKIRSHNIMTRREIVTHTRILKQLQEDLTNAKYLNRGEKEKGIKNANKREISLLRSMIRDRKEIIKDTKASLKKHK